MNWLDETSTEAEKLKKELENTEWKLRELKDINGKCQTSYAFFEGDTRRAIAGHNDYGKHRGSA